MAFRDRWVDAGILASLVWVVAILPFLAWPNLLVNLVLLSPKSCCSFGATKNPCGIYFAERSPQESARRVTPTDNGGQRLI